ncbi:MAG: DNA translocase FtsK 4TM domain-containing protein [Phycisphaeraceae bacterium]
MWPYILWAVLAGTWILAVVSLASYDPTDWPGHAAVPHNARPANWAGLVGAMIAHHLYLMIGPGIWIAVTGWLVFMVATARKRPLSQPVMRVLGILLMCLATSAIVAVAAPHLSNRPEGAGGLVAIYLTDHLVARFNTFGSMLILAIVFWIAAVLAMDQVVIAASRLLGKGCLALAKIRVPRPVLAGRFGRLAGATSGTGGKGLENDLMTLRPRRVKPQAAIVDDEVEGEIDEEDAKPQAAVADEDDVAADAPGAYVQEKQSAAFDPEALRAKIKQMPINFAPKGKTTVQAPREVDMSGYQFPGMDLLVEPETNFTQEMERLVRDQAIQLEEALQQYRIDGEVVGIDSGPVITLFEVRLAPGTKVSVLSAVASDLARALKAQNIRIVPNMAGKDTVGVEVPNLKKERVRLKELMTTNPEELAKMKLPMFLGKDASGAPLVQDLASMPHMLIAGTTGSGKSVCMNSIIMSFLFTRRPDELKLVLVDPKMVEMSLFKDIPHLMCPVVTEMSKAAAILEWATTKMDERYELLAEAGVRDVAGYNSLGWNELKERFNPTTEQEEAQIPKKLPYLVFVIDELADLMMTNKEVEGSIVRIAQKARAVGIHLILATQRPQANVVTGLIKSNMPCRVAFKVASGMDSRIVLDQKGGELLLGQGDMLYLSPRSSKLTRAQGTLVDDMEIRATVKFLKTIAQQNFEPQLVQLRAPGVEGDGQDVGERDPLFEDAVRVVLESQRGSVSLLQRRLTIGYSRSSRLIEQIFQAGLLGEYKGSQAREVLMSLEEYEALKAQAEADAAVEVNGTVPDDEDGADADDDDGVPDEMDGEYRR